MDQVIPASELHSVLSQAHNDLYKEVNGIRPRWIRYSKMNTPELEALMIALMEDAEERVSEWDGFDARIEAEEAAETAEREAIRVEAERAHEERFMDAAAAWGGAGW